MTEPCEGTLSYLKQQASFNIHHSSSCMWSPAAAATSCLSCFSLNVIVFKACFSTNPYAVMQIKNPRTQWEWGMQGGGGGAAVSLMRLMSRRLSVWELPEKNPSTQDRANNSGSHRRRTSSDLVRIHLFLSEPAPLLSVHSCPVSLPLFSNTQSL